MLMAVSLQLCTRICCDVAYCDVQLLSNWKSNLKHDKTSRTPKTRSGRAEGREGRPFAVCKTNGPVAPSTRAGRSALEVPELGGSTLLCTPAPRTFRWQLKGGVESLACARALTLAPTLARTQLANRHLHRKQGQLLCGFAYRWNISVTPLTSKRCRCDWCVRVHREGEFGLVEGWRSDSWWWWRRYSCKLVPEIAATLPDQHRLKLRNNIGTNYQ